MGEQLRPWSPVTFSRRREWPSEWNVAEEINWVRTKVSVGLATWKTIARSR